MLAERLERAFYAGGWLLPVLLPLAQAGGRAAFHLLAGLYVLWGVLALYRRGLPGERVALGLYALLLLSYALPILLAVDSLRAADKWLSFAYQSAAFPLTLAALYHNGAAGLRRLRQALGIGGLLLLGGLLLQLIPLLTGDDWQPEQQLREDNLGWLLPFLLIAPCAAARRRRGLYTVTVLLLTLGYIVLSGGRAALLGAVLGLAVYSLLGWRWPLRRVLLLTGVVLLLGVAVNAGHFVRSAHQQTTLPAALDTFTSLRTVLWRQALAQPPDNLLLGVGMGNVRYQEAVVVVDGLHLSHLHNFLLDAWYETGVLGLTALLLFIAYALRRGWRVRRRAAAYLAAVTALLSTGLLSFSYASVQFALYLPLLLAVLLWLGRPCKRRLATDNRVNTAAAPSSPP